MFEATSASVPPALWNRNFACFFLNSTTLSSQIFANITLHISSRHSPGCIPSMSRMTLWQRKSTSTSCRASGFRGGISGTPKGPLQFGSNVPSHTCPPRSYSGRSAASLKSWRPATFLKILVRSGEPSVIIPTLAELVRLSSTISSRSARAKTVAGIPLRVARITMNGLPFSFLTRISLYRTAESLRGSLSAIRSPSQSRG